MTKLEQTLQEENKRLQEENENLCQQVGQLQTQLSTMTAREKTIKPLIEEIKRQEREITSLNSSRTAERRKNEKLLELSKNERMLKSENEKLKNENNRLDAELIQEKKNLKASVDKYNTIINMFPDDKKVEKLLFEFESLSETVQDVQHRVNHISWNWKERIIISFFIVVFFVLGQIVIQRWFTPDTDYAKRIMWNIEYGKPHVNFFEDEKEAKEKYDNQRHYEILEDLKKKQEK